MEFFVILCYAVDTEYPFRTFNEAVVLSCSLDAASLNSSLFDLLVCHTQSSFNNSGLSYILPITSHLLG